MELDSAKSRIIKMNGMSFLTELIFRYAGIWLLVLSATAVDGLVLGIAVDLRWFVAGLMIVFLIIPMAMAFLYYYYGLRKECFVNTVPHVISLMEDGINVKILVPDTTDDTGPDAPGNEQSSNADGSSATVNSEASGTLGSAPSFREIRTEFFPFSAMLPMRIGHDSAIIPFAPPAKGFIWIPADAFDSADSLADILEYIDTHIKKCAS